MSEQEPINYMMPGETWRRGFQASVDAILAGDTCPVFSMGKQFYNQDRWTCRFLLPEMCQWASQNPGAMPTRAIVAEWVKAANKQKVPYRKIVVAACPNVIDHRMAMALTGGAYHEAFHTKYSCRRNLRVDEIAAIVIPRWAQVKDWSRYLSLLLHISNLCEDIRIERRGCEDYPGVRVKMADLQDFILNMEAEGGREVRAHGAKKGAASKKRPAEALNTLLAAYRDVGLNYPTVTQRAALEGYKQANPEAVQMVLEGPLKPILKANIAQGADDYLGHIVSALDIIIILDSLQGSQDEPRPEGEEGEGEEGEGEGEGSPLVECPQCKAGADKLVIRVQPDKSAILTCTACGFQQAVELQPGGAGGGLDQGQSIRIIGGENLGVILSPSKGKEVEEGSREPGEPGEGESMAAMAPFGGGYEDKGAIHEGNEWVRILAEQIQAEIDAGFTLSLKDNNSAMSEGASPGKGDSQRANEKPWAVYDPSNDIIANVPPSKRGQQFDRKQAEAIANSVRVETAYMRARLRQLVRAQEQVGSLDGLPRGKDLTRLFLVDCKVALMAHEMPRRSHRIVDTQTDTSTAAAIILDESGSISNIQADMARALYALAEALSVVGCKTLIAGVRNGQPVRNVVPSELRGSYHRQDSVRVDVFKTFEEHFSTAAWKLANTYADGGTPLADGVQYGLKALATRREAYRICFVFTDGAPDYPHQPVLRWQQRQAKKEGIHFLYVGLGAPSAYVKELGADFVWAADVASLPNPLIAKLTEILRRRLPRSTQRGK